MWGKTRIGRRGRGSDDRRSRSTGVADYYPSDQSRAGFEIETKVLYFDQSSDAAPTFTDVTFDGYQPNKLVAAPQRVNLVCANARGQVGGVSVGPRGASTDAVDGPLGSPISDPWHAGTIHGVADITPGAARAVQLALPVRSALRARDIG
jgi:hypothetical protein